MVASASAAAAPARISGSVNKRGYTLIALSSSGKAVSVLVKGHTFRLRPPATRVTLHLRSPNGVYAGPVVVGTKSKRKVAILGVKAGARLGTIKVRRGYASLAKRLSTRWVDTRRYARAKKGVPTGAGVFGRVRSRHVHATVPGDSDLDGIPDIFEIDDDGDRILDAFDSSNVVRAAQNGEPGFQLQTSLSVNLDDTANADAPGLTPAQLDAAMVNLGRLEGPPPERPVTVAAREEALGVAEQQDLGVAVEQDDRGARTRNRLLLEQRAPGTKSLQMFTNRRVT